MSRNIKVFACLVSLCMGITSASAQVIFSDDFNSGASASWGNEVGNWTAAGGVYSALAPNNSPPTYSGLPFVLADFSIDVDINDLQDGGIWLRSANNANGVLLVTGGFLGTGTGLYWHTVTGGSVSAPANLVSGLFSPGVSDAHIRVEVIGDTYSAYVNGSTTAATTLVTNAFPTGRVALYDFSNQTFDNVVVAVIPEPGGLVVVGLGLGSLFPRRSSISRQRAVR